VRLERPPQLNRLTIQEGDICETDVELLDRDMPNVQIAMTKPTEEFMKWIEYPYQRSLRMPVPANFPNGFTDGIIKQVLQADFANA
jgi:hypothetical protein